MESGKLDLITSYFQLYTFNAKFAGMMELADMQDLGDVTSGKVFRGIYYGKA